jgi:hypothetical protein
MWGIIIKDIVIFTVTLTINMSLQRLNTFPWGHINSNLKVISVQTTLGAH